MRGRLGHVDVDVFDRSAPAPKDFLGDLANQTGFLEGYFERLLRIGGGSETANAALNEWYVLRKKENARRVLAVDAYLRILDNISEGHQNLYDSRNDLDAVQLVKDLFKLAKEIRKNVTALMKAYGRETRCHAFDSRRCPRYCGRVS